MRAIQTFVGALFGDSEALNGPRRVRGLPASPGVYEGSARLVTDLAQLGLLKQGDVLVTHSTGEAFNIVLPLLGAIVTDSGGLLSHHVSMVSRA